MYDVSGIFGVCCDAVVTDSAGNLVFASFWGRDTAVQEFLARLTVSVAEGGLDSFAIHTLGHKQVVYPRDVERLTKHTGRMPKGNLFGEMVNLWLFDPITQEPDRVNRRAVLLSRDEQISPTQLWRLVRDVCHLPLLESWQPILMPLFLAQGWVQSLVVVQGGGLQAIQINLGNDVEVERLVEQLIHQGQLTADEPTQTISAFLP